MAHKILVMSPLHNVGSSTVSLMLSQGLTYDGKSTTLLFTQTGSLVPRYIGIEDVKDPTRSVMQIVKLIDNGAINDSDIIDYAYQYTKNGWLLNASDESMADKDREQVIKHVYSRVTTDVVICDNSEDITSPITSELLSESDLLFIVIDMSTKARERLQKWLESPVLKDFKDIYIIVNNYNEVVSSVRNYAKVLKLPANRVCKLHYNPWITKCTAVGQLHTILPLSKELDPRVCNLNCDINELSQCVNGAMILKIKKGF